MAIIFLIGGTGNQLFQFATSREVDKFSNLFLLRPVRKVLNWTDHESIFNFPGVNRGLDLLAVTLLTLDLMIFKLLKVTFFSDIDTRSIKSKPRIVRLVAIGYFQDRPIQRPLSELAEQLQIDADSTGSPKVALHIRGGDLLNYQKIGKNTYGVLDDKYYSQAICSISAKLDEIVVFTDDRAHAQNILREIDPEEKVTINVCGLREMFSACVGSSMFVSSNSTLSFWVICLRGPKTINVAPTPYVKRNNIRLPFKVKRIPVVYE